MRPSVSFDRMAERYDATRGGEARGTSVAAAVLPHLGAGPVLELGVGTGLVAAAVARLGRSVLGCDLSDAMLRQAVPRLPGRVVRADVQRLPFADASIGSCLAVHVLHLVGDRRATLTEAARVLGPNGRLVVVVIEPARHGDDVFALVEAMTGRLRDGAPRPDDPAVLVPIAQDAGLRLVDEVTHEEEVVEHTPHGAARGVEERLWSALWDVPADTWDAVVRPTVDALRALPDQDRVRSHAQRRRLLVFTPAG